MLSIWKFPKNIAGRTKCPRRTHAARGLRVWDSCSRKNREIFWRLQPTSRWLL